MGNRSQQQAAEDPEEEGGYYDRGVSTAHGLLNKLFASCAADPRGSVHRAWGVSLIFVILYFVVSLIESECTVFIYLIWDQHCAVSANVDAVLPAFRGGIVMFVIICGRKQNERNNASSGASGYPRRRGLVLLSQISKRGGGGVAS